MEWCSNLYFPLAFEERGERNGSAGESESVLFFIAWGAEGRYLFCVCGSSFMLCCLYYFLGYLVLYVCTYGVHGGMHETVLLGEKRFGGPGQSSAVEPGEHDEQGQGRTASHKFMHILGKVYFVGHTARADAAARFLFVSSPFVMKWD